MPTREVEISEGSKLTLSAVVATCMLVATLVAWGARVEFGIQTKVPKEQYFEDMNVIKEDLRDIKKALNIKKKGTKDDSMGSD